MEINTTDRRQGMGSDYVLRVGLGLILLFGGSACGGEDGASESREMTQPSSNTVLASNLRSCGLVSEGDVFPPGVGTLNSCIRACLNELSDCDALTYSFCEYAGTYSQGYEQYDSCVNDCEDLDEFFVCNDGYEIPSSWVCDIESDCSGGEDEAGCDAEFFTCDGGDKIPLTWVCNFEEDCVDGTDEAASCAHLTCPEQ